MKTPFEGATAILPVRDLSKSVTFYTDVLSFSVDFVVEESGFAAVSRGSCHLFLCQGDQGHPGTWVWIGVSDVVDVHRELTERGASIRHPPTPYPWAYEMQVEDPDGNVLRLGSEPLPGEPVGEWLDMRGERWVCAAEGGWSRV